MTTPNKQPKKASRQARRLEARTKPQVKKSKKKETKKQKYLKLTVQAKAQKNDPRYREDTTDLSTLICLSNQNPNLTLEVPIKQDALKGIALGPVTYALQRGWSVSANVNYPAQAFLYITQQLVNYVQTGKVNMLAVPRWLALVGQSLIQKTVPFLAGSSAYKFVLDDSSVGALLPGSMIAIGPTSYARDVSLGVIDPAATVNNVIPTLDAALAIPYDEEIGQQAWSSLMQFLQNANMTKPGRARMHDLLPPTQMVKTSKDASAYAVVMRSPGSGFAGCGGIGLTVENDTPARHPIFAVVKTPVAQVFDPARFGNHNYKVAGDPIFLGGIMAGLLEPSQVGMSTAPCLKPVDFLEIVEVQALIAQRAVQMLLDDPTNQGLVTVDVSQFLCPLTILEMEIMLRGVVMNSYKDTQHLVQGLYPWVPANGENKFVPFVAGVGTCAQPGATEPLLTLPLVENIRSLTYRSNHGGIRGKSNPRMWIPILGKYYGDAISQDDYTVTFGEVTLPLFRPTDALVFERTEKRKTGDVDIYGAEVAINIIDGNTGSVYAAINDPGALNFYAEKWNQWIKRISAYLVPLTPVGTDAGITILESITMTQHWITNPVSPGKRKDKRMVDRFSLPLNSPYANRGVAEVSSAMPIYTSCWEMLQQSWILPTNESVTGNNATNQNDQNKMRSLWGEPFTVVLSGGGAPPSINERHSNFASLNVMNRWAKNDSVTEFLVDAAKHGRGGILSSLAASALKAATGIDLTGLASVIPV